MTTDILTAAGEEYVAKNGLDGATLTIGVYNDTTDDVQDSDNDVGTAITSEPTNTAYSSESDTFSAAEITGDEWGVENDSAISFDFSDTATDEDVDAFYITANFTSTEGGGSGDHLIATAAMSQTRDVGSVDSIDLAAGDLTITFE